MEWPEVETEMMGSVVLTTLEVLVGQHWAKMVAAKLNCPAEEKRVGVENWWGWAAVAVHYYWNWKAMAVEWWQRLEMVMLQTYLSEIKSNFKAFLSNIKFTSKNQRRKYQRDQILMQYSNFSFRASKL